MEEINALFWTEAAPETTEATSIVDPFTEPVQVGLVYIGSSYAILKDEL